MNSARTHQSLKKLAIIILLYGNSSRTGDDRSGEAFDLRAIGIHFGPHADGLNRPITPGNIHEIHAIIALCLIVQGVCSPGASVYISSCADLSTRPQYRQSTPGLTIEPNSVLRHSKIFIDIFVKPIYLSTTTLPRQS